MRGDRDARRLTQDQDSRRRYYDHVHYSADETRQRAERKLSVADPWYRLIIDLLERNDFPLGGRRVLEVGCGLGGFSLHLARQEAGVTALDFSHSAVSSAAALAVSAPNGGIHPRFLTADARRLPFRDATFDLVVCAETLEHTFALRECMREFARVCAPGGGVAVTVPNSLVSLPLDSVVSAVGVGQPQSPVNYFTVRRAAAAAGFRVVDGFGTNFCRLMFSEDVLPPVVRRVTERIGASVEPRMHRGHPLWVLAAGTVGLLLEKADGRPPRRPAE
jgi:ubiquinone/menaquinone biosynthesis C-methylase UbiE